MAQSEYPMNLVIPSVNYFIFEEYFPPSVFSVEAAAICRNCQCIDYFDWLLLVRLADERLRAVTLVWYNSNVPHTHWRVQDSKNPSVQSFAKDHMKWRHDLIIYCELGIFSVCLLTQLIKNTNFSTFSNSIFLGHLYFSQIKTCLSSSISSQNLHFLSMIS